MIHRLYSNVLVGHISYGFRRNRISKLVASKKTPSRTRICHALRWPSPASIFFQGNGDGVVLLPTPFVCDL